MHALEFGDNLIFYTAWNLLFITTFSQHKFGSVLKQKVSNHSAAFSYLDPLRYKILQHK